MKEHAQSLGKVMIFSGGKIWCHTRCLQSGKWGDQCNWCSGGAKVWVFSVGKQEMRVPTWVPKNGSQGDLHSVPVLLALNCKLERKIKKRLDMGKEEEQIYCLPFPKAGKAFGPSGPHVPSTSSHKTLESRGQKVFESYSRNELSLPCFGMIMVTGMPEPRDGRLRDTVNGASQDLSAAQWVESRVWKRWYSLFINLGFHWKEKIGQRSRAVLMTPSWTTAKDHILAGVAVRETHMDRTLGFVIITPTEKRMYIPTTMIKEKRIILLMEESKQPWNSWDGE